MNLGIGLGLAFRPVIGSASGPPAKTYTDFQAHIATLATSGVEGGFNNPGSWRYTLSAPTAGMAGSSWLQQYLPNADTRRVIQHACPSQVVFDALVAAGREVFFVVIDSGTTAPVALNRNGFLSSGDPEVYPSRAMTSFIYWDGTQAQQMNPSTGTGPTPYPIP